MAAQMDPRSFSLLVPVVRADDTGLELVIIGTEGVARIGRDRGSPQVLSEHHARVSRPGSAKASLPLLNVAVIPGKTVVPQNQAVRIPMIALILRRPIAKRPMHLRIHITEDALGRRDEVWTMRRCAFAQFLGAMPVMWTRDQMGERGQPGAS